MQILDVNVYRVVPLQVSEVPSPHHLHYSIPVPTFSSAVKCFELSAVGVLSAAAESKGSKRSKLKESKVS